MIPPLAAPSVSDALERLLADLHDAGYDAVTSVSDSEEATGQVLLPPEHRRDPPRGWRRFLPRLYCDASDPALVPDELRAIVEAHGWTVQAMGRDDETVTVIVSRNGV